MSTQSPYRLRTFASAPLAAILLLALALPARAGVGVWTPASPQGGTVNVFAVSPSAPRFVFAGTPKGGVFKSADGGRTWSSSSQGLGDATGFPAIASLEVDPHRPATVYAGTLAHGAFRSGDGGASWSRCGALPANGGLGAKAGVVKADPADPRIVYAGTPFGFFRSRDGCATWAPRGATLPAGEVLALGFDPAGRYLYAGLRNNGVYRSTDQGGRWEKANAGLPALVQTLGFDPRSPSVVFAGTSNGLYRSVDRGRSWARVGTDLLLRSVKGFGFLGLNGKAYAATQDGVFVSPNRGTTWSRVAGALPVPQLLGFTVGRDALFAGSGEDRRGGGVARSADGGATWQVANQGLSTLRVLEMAFHPTDRATLYATTGTAGLFKSTNGGLSWRQLPFGASNPDIAASGVAVEAVRPDTVYAGGEAVPALLRSDDAGATWRDASPEVATAMNVLRPDPRFPGGLWAGGVGTALHTVDGGATWERISFPGVNYPWIYDIEVDPSDPRIVTYAGAQLLGFRPPRQEAILFRTEDGGATWNRIPTDVFPGIGSGSAVVAFATDRGSPGTSYAATSSGLYRTENEEAGWEQLLAFVREEGDVVATEEAIYASRGANVLRSTDRGETWTSIRNGLGARPVVRLWVDPQDPRHLFAGTSNAGLYEYTLPAAP